MDRMEFNSGLCIKTFRKMKWPLCTSTSLLDEVHGNLAGVNVNWPWPIKCPWQNRGATKTNARASSAPFKGFWSISGRGERGSRWPGSRLKWRWLSNSGGNAVRKVPLIYVTEADMIDTEMVKNVGPGFVNSPARADSAARGCFFKNEQIKWAVQMSRKWAPPMLGLFEMSSLH